MKYFRNSVNLLHKGRPTHNISAERANDVRASI
jgi:hypothetical protein